MKHFFLSLFSLLLLAAVLPARDKAPAVAVVVDPATYQAIRADVDAFTASMTLVGKEGILVIDRWGHPDSLRAELCRLYAHDGLEGAVLIGAIPVPMVRDAHHMTTAFKMSPARDWKDSSVPSDRLYDDFDLRFDYLKQDGDAPLLHYYSLRADSPQVIHCDIWTSRIKPPQIPGVSAPEAIAQYLRKAVAAKAVPRERIRRVLHFAGHGYNSESLQARIDEEWTLREQFPQLGRDRGSCLDFLNYNQDKVVRTRLLQLLSLDKYDLAILHHHGSPDQQLLSATMPGTMPRDLLGAAKVYFRGKVRDAKDPAATKARFMKEFDLPESFFEDSPALTAADSTLSAQMDINIPDLYGYTSNVRLLILDACFNGSFNNDDYIAGYHIFSPGKCIVVKANTVNTLQDTWTNELIGLLGCGVCVGNWAKGQMTLESHLLGDASWRFANDAPKYDIDRAMTARRNDLRFWKKLRNCGIADIESLALKTLASQEFLSSQELLAVERDDPRAILRLAAFMALKRRADAHLPEAIRLGLEDSYELLQRLAALTAAVSGDPSLSGLVQALAEDPSTSPRVAFQLKGGLPAYKPSEHAQEEFRALTNPEVSLRDKRFTVSAQRNNCNPFCVAPMLAWFRQCEDVPMRTAIAETLGWYRYSYKKDEILAACRTLLEEEKEPAVRNELEKTVRRLTDK
ncbi:MAG: hypothetical protein IKG90_07525 [Bacteroidales bacterium]|nr:hypothetical protein [Bacteroidales bacterium]